MTSRLVDNKGGNLLSGCQLGESISESLDFFLVDAYVEGEQITLRIV
jgi:hypothetical protein